MIKLAFLNIFLLSSCVGVHLPFELSEKKTVNSSEVVERDLDGLFFVRGAFQELLPDNSERLLWFKDELRQPSVLIFSSEFCQICQEETLKISEELNEERGFGSPVNVNFYTIMVENDSFAAQDFRDAWRVSWKIGYDAQSLFSKYCSEQTTPCTLIVDPHEGVLLSKNGETSLEEIESYTGPWRGSEEEIEESGEL